MMKHWIYKLLYCFNFSQASYDWQNTNRLIFVCLGNICRSPYAEYYAKKIGLNSLSYGLKATTQSPADPTAILVAKSRHIDLSIHRSKPISDYVYEKGDIIFVFEPYQINQIKQLNLSAPIELLGKFHIKKIPCIADPYKKSPEYFDQCYTIIEQSIQTIERLIKAKKT